MTHPNPRPNGWPGGLSPQAEREISGVFRGSLNTKIPQKQRVSLLLRDTETVPRQFHRFNTTPVI
jgi:hypothetical protein